MLPPLPRSWKPVLADQLRQPYFAKLREFVEREQEQYRVFPPASDIFNALKYTPYDEVRVVLLGQDPYHGEGQAHGLAFSVRPGVRRPPSLANVFKELHADVGCPKPKDGSLVPWAEQGVLLLNAVLTVRAHQANSHKNKGWEKFTDAVITAVGHKPDPVVFLLWGSPAQKKMKLIDTGRHVIIRSAHPSPLSARAGFFGSKPFSKANAALAVAGKPPVEWCLPPA